MNHKIAKILTDKNLTLSVAESCTGGLISSVLTDVPGSSAYIKLNFVTYSNEAKIKVLGVPEETINTNGAVSEQTATAMAEGTRKVAETDIGLGITGIAGPGGGSAEKPVGLCYIGISDNTRTEVYKINANPELERKEIKNYACRKALEYLHKFLNKKEPV